MIKKIEVAHKSLLTTYFIDLLYHDIFYIYYIMAIDFVTESIGCEDGNGYQWKCF